MDDHSWATDNRGPERSGGENAGRYGGRRPYHTTGASFDERTSQDSQQANPPAHTQTPNLQSRKEFPALNESSGLKASHPTQLEAKPCETATHQDRARATTAGDDHGATRLIQPGLSYSKALRTNQDGAVGCDSSTPAEIAQNNGENGTADSDDGWNPPETCATRELW